MKHLVGAQKVYVVSLVRDCVRRDKMRQRFEESWPSFSIVDAVDANHLPTNVPKPCHEIRRRPLASAEIAFSLSHLEVWRQFLASDAETCLIFEDDVEGNEESLMKARNLARHLPDGAFLLLGGLQGLRNRRFVYGRRQSINGIRCLWLPAPNRRFLARTCCYALTRKAATELLTQQETCLDRADHWNRLLRYNRSIYFADLFAHPTDFSLSHIEPSRRIQASKPLIHRILADGIFYTTTTALIKLAWPSIARLTGLEPASPD